MMKDKNLKQNDDTLSLIILKRMEDNLSLTMRTIEKQSKERLEFVEKYVNEKIEKVEKKVDELNIVCKNISEDQIDFFKAIGDSLSNRQMAETNLANEFDRFADNHCTVEERKIVKKIIDRENFNDDVKNKITAGNKYNLGTLRTVIISGIIMLVLSTTTSIVVAKTIMKPAIQKQEVKTP